MKLKFWVFVGLSGITGGLVAVVAGVIFHLFQLETWQFKTVCFLCPPTFLSMAGADNVIFYIIAINILFYMGMGAFIWLGIRKRKIFFIIPILIMASWAAIILPLQ
jgi:hypothetical protein